MEGLMNNKVSSLFTESSYAITFYGYLIYFILIATLLSGWFIFFAIKFWKECSKGLIDIYRIIQYSILLLYLLSVIIVDGLKFINDFQYYNITTFVYILIGYYLSDLVNITCWITLIVHSKYYTGKEQFTRDKIK